jgi:hypothetical protein
MIAAIVRSFPVERINIHPYLIKTSGKRQPMEMNAENRRKTQQRGHVARRAGGDLVLARPARFMIIYSQRSESFESYER